MTPRSIFSALAALGLWAPLALQAVCVPPASAAAPPGGVLIDQAWIRTPPRGALTAAAYAHLTNRGPKTDRLVGASAAGAEGVAAHTMSMAGGVMSMRPALGGLELAPGRTLVLAPGQGAHLMIIRPKRPLQPGARLAVTLRFERAGPETALFTVADAPPSPASR
jgi:copper(I)-binding protein